MSKGNLPGETSAQIAAYGGFSFIMGIILAVIGGAAGNNIVLEGFGALAILIGLPVMIFGAILWNRSQRKARRTNSEKVSTESVFPRMNPYGPVMSQPIIVQAPSTHSEVTREIVKVRCRNCNSLNFETANKCVNCGAGF